MENITFETMPKAIKEIYAQNLRITQMLTEWRNEYKPTSADNELMTIEEAAKFLNLAKQTIYGMVSKDAIPYTKKSKRLYFSKVELLEWLNN